MADSATIRVASKTEHNADTNMPVISRVDVEALHVCTMLVNQSISIPPIQFPMTVRASSR